MKRSDGGTWPIRQAVYMPPDPSDDLARPCTDGQFTFHQSAARLGRSHTETQQVATSVKVLPNRYAPRSTTPWPVSIKLINPIQITELRHYDKLPMSSNSNHFKNQETHDLQIHAFPMNQM